MVPIYPGQRHNTLVNSVTCYHVGVITVWKKYPWEVVVHALPSAPLPRKGLRNDYPCLIIEDEAFYPLTILNLPIWVYSPSSKLDKPFVLTLSFVLLKYHTCALRTFILTWKNKCF